MSLSPGNLPRRGSRRDWLADAAGGIVGLALAQLLARDGLAGDGGELQGADPTGSNAAQGLHHPPRARRVVQLFMSGAASQCDTFDYKPELARRAGQPFDPGGKIELFQSQPGTYMPSPWKWNQHGECGRWVSELLPELATCVDDLAVIYSMVSKSNVHGPATFLQATGFVLPGFPSVGSWVSYALGSENDDLPTFVAIPDARGFAPNGPANWGAGFLPAAHQGTMLRPAAANPIENLFAPVDAGPAVAGEDQARALLAAQNRRHLSSRGDDSRLAARIATYELAGRLQVSAPEALDLAQETAETRALYGLDDEATADFGRSCLVARRLLERGVRFVQVWSGADNGFPRRNWDSHEDLARDHGTMGRSLDRPAAALVKDLKRTGLLNDTIVLWTTEFGRMPCSQGSLGRDHNPEGFASWVAGGGFRGGVGYGATDEWSYRAVENPVTGYDLHATILHLLGIDHERLTFRHNGLDRRLTDVHGRVLTELLA